MMANVPGAVGEFVTGGLTSDQVAERVRRGQVNAVSERTSRSLVHILRANVVTRFNALLGSLLVLVLIAGSWKDATFGVVLVVNSLVGVVQELRAKRGLDRLAVLTVPRVRVWCDGSVAEIALGEVVLDDVLELASGDQVPADGWCWGPTSWRSTSRC
jgi:cation-transporting ATPase E